MRRLEAAYEQARCRVTDLVAGAPSRLHEAPVPACPDWSVHDLVAHLTGVCADVLAGRIAGAATDSWTAAQVAARRDTPTAVVVREWDDVGPRFAAMIDDFPGRLGAQVVADVITHEHDLRAALDRPGWRDSEGVVIGAEFFATVFLQPAITLLRLPSLEVRAGDRTWVLGGGTAPATLDEVWQSALLATPGCLSTDAFELCRAVSGRRSTGQIRRLGWTVDPEPYLPAFGYGPFSVPEVDMAE